MAKEKDKIEKEIEKLEKQFENYDEQVKKLTLDQMNKAPVKETEEQTKLSTKEIDKSNETYLKPERRISSPEKFNENYREKYNFAKEYVNFIAENKEIIGESIEIWTKPFAGIPAEFWKVPVNKPVWAPRYVAEQIKSRFYHRLKIDEAKIQSQDGMGQYYGSLVVDETVERLTARPVQSKRSIFVGANG